MPSEPGKGAWQSMNSDDIRNLVQQVLAEELKGLSGHSHGAHADTTPQPQVREERVSMRTDADLRRFALRMIELAADGRSVQEIKAGRWVFRLDDSGSGGNIAADHSHPVGKPEPELIEFDRGLISERQVTGLSQGARVRIGKRVRFTPLAQDEIRRKRIRVERKST